MQQKISTYLKASLLAVVLVVGLTTLQAAWLAPAGGTIPPNGNPSVPINTSSAIQTKAVGGDICIEKVAGTVKCLSAMTPLPPPVVSGTVSSSAATCNIAAGNSTCNINFTWSTTNATTPNLYNSTRSLQYSAAASGGPTSFAIVRGANTVQVRDGSTVLNTVSPAPTASCATGTVWNAGSGTCAASSATLGFKTGWLNNCIIPANASTCNTWIYWNMTSVTSPNVYNSKTSTTYSSSASSPSGGNPAVGTQVSMGYGANTIQARDGTSVLNSISDTSVCELGSFWNGSICESPIAIKKPRTITGAYYSTAMYNNRIYIFGGLSNLGILDKVGEYDPVSNTWAERGPIPTGPVYFETNQASVVGTKIYLMGGYTCNPTCAGINKNQEYNPVTDTWSTPRAPIPIVSGVLQYQSPTASDGTKIYLIGELGTQVYTPSLNTWVNRAPSPRPASISGTSAVHLAGKIYVMGGGDRNQVYNIGTNIWTPLPAHPGPSTLIATSVAEAGGLIYVIGGQTCITCSYSYESYVYNPTTNSWKKRSDYTIFQVGNAGGSSYGGKIYLIGGNTISGFVDWVTEYDPVKDLKI